MKTAEKMTITLQNIVYICIVLQYMIKYVFNPLVCTTWRAMLDPQIDNIVRTSSQNFSVVNLGISIFCSVYTDKLDSVSLLFGGG